MTKAKLDSNDQTPDPHGEQPLYSRGPEPEHASGAIILLHGRGASAESILGLYEELELPELSALAPQAAGSSWYPYSFMVEVTANQPWLDSALRKIEKLVLSLIQRQVPSERIALIGFSQGACLALEYAARSSRQFGGVIGLTGGLIGASLDIKQYSGSLNGTEVFLAAGDPDPHVPFSRVEESAKVFRGLDAKVEVLRYPGMAHTVNEEEIYKARHILQKITKDS